GVGNRVLMLENAWYSVISPEMCAQILWRDVKRAPEAAESLKLTARDLLEFKVIDEVIPEPLGGAHRAPDVVAANIKQAIVKHLAELDGIPGPELAKERVERYRRLGAFQEATERKIAAMAGEANGPASE